MIRYQITYESQNEYEQEVREAFFEFLVKPAEFEGQNILKDEVHTSSGDHVFESWNVFGYAKLCVRLSKAFKEFKFKYSCLLEKSPFYYIPTDFDMLPLEQEQAQLDDVAFQVDAYPFLSQSPLTALKKEEIPEYMLRLERVSLLNYVKFLNQSIHQFLSYTPKQSTPHTQADETVRSRRGVCQDYAHFMLGILRAQSIPCRYVSGYLYQGAQEFNNPQLHAWVEVLFPKYGWLGLDPTNNVFADQHHIKISDGQDYLDCQPINGFINPGTPNSTEYSIQIIGQHQQ